MVHSNDQPTKLADSETSSLSSLPAQTRVVLLPLAVQAIQIIASLALVSYALGRIYLERYYKSAGIHPTSLDFGNQDYVFASFEMVALSTVLLVFAILIIKFRLVALSHRLIERNDRTQSIQDQFSVISPSLLILIISGIFIILDLPSSDNWPGLWGLSTGILLGLLSASVSLAAPVYAEGILTLGYVLTRRTGIAKLVILIIFGILTPIAYKPATAYVRAKAFTTRKNEETDENSWHRRLDRHSADKFNTNRRELKSLIPDWMLFSEWLKNEPKLAYITGTVILTPLIVIVPLLTNRLAVQNLQRDISDRIPLHILKLQKTHRFYHNNRSMLLLELMA